MRETWIRREMTGEHIIKARKMRGNKRRLFATLTSKMLAEALWQGNPAAGFLLNSLVFGRLPNPFR